MKAIDFHIHYIRRESLNATWRDYLEEINPAYYADVERFAEDPSALTDYLDSQGVESAVVLPECAPATSGHVHNEDVINYCRGQKRLLPFASINPNLHGDPAKKLEQYIKEGGVRGLKLHPSYQFFYPNEARLYPIYEKAQEYRIPVVFHIGSSIFKGTRLKYCDPIHLDDVAVDFPDLTILMAHSGRGFWYDACFFLSRLHENVYMDITGLPPQRLLHYFPEFEKNAGKVIFGSDWPTMPADIGKNISAIRSLPLGEAALEAILHTNASKVLMKAEVGQ